MILRLRKKFIWINMLLVSAVLLIVFFAVCFSTYRRLESDSVNAMRQAVGKQVNEPPRLEIGGRRPLKHPALAPVFVVELAEDGAVVSVRGENVTVDGGVEQAVALALAGGSRLGLIAEYRLRYLIADTPEGRRIAFADTSQERSSMASLLATSLVVGIGALIAFFLVSLFLARWALRPVERAWAQQQQFVADASHELKTPLTVILANMGILLSHPGDTVREQIKWVENTGTEAMRMKKLVDDLLFLAKSDAAKKPLLSPGLDFSDIVWSGVLPFESVAFEQGVELDSDITPGILVDGDEGQLKQLVAILADNACKYAGAGGKASVALRREQDKAVLSVWNSGAAIPKEDLPHLFERFYRADKSRARDSGGYGLGLAIARSIADSHGGRITVESGPVNGTRFNVRLPAKGPD